jgi:hypothetical protein
MKMIEDCKYILIPVHKAGIKNTARFFQSVTEICYFLHVKRGTPILMYLDNGEELRGYFVDLNPLYWKLF